MPTSSMPHETRMTRARTHLLLQYPYWGSPAMHLKLVADSSIPTAAVDGISLFYNPDFIAGLSDDELLFLIAHEVSHCTFLHIFRRGNRDMGEWNEAADYAINQILVDAAVGSMPKGGLLDAKYKGMPADQVFALRRGQKQQNPQQSQNTQLCPTGTFRDSPNAGKGKSSQSQQQSNGQPQNANRQPTPSNNSQSGKDDNSAGQEKGLSEHEWQIIAESAAITANKAGKLPAGAHIALKDSSHQPQDWRQITREFITHTFASDCSWSHPNRRYVSSGLYLPGVVKENRGEMVIVLDSSGSTLPILSPFAAETSALISEVRPEKVVVICCDAKVHDSQEFYPGDEVKLTAKGGGGTAFQPAFNWINERIESGELNPRCVIYLTDLDSFDTPSEPSYPVLWVSPNFVTRKAPFGREVKIDTGLEDI